MTTKPGKYAVEVVAKFLWERWDPIGVSDGEPYFSDNPDAGADEYDRYAPQLAKLLQDGVDECRLSKRLSDISVRSLGLTPDPERDRSAAEGLIKYWQERQA